jgi:hypothetical protein
MNACCEPTLADALADPLTQAVMAADGVDARQLEITLRDVARRLARQPRRIVLEAPSLSPEL